MRRRLFIRAAALAALPLAAVQCQTVRHGSQVKTVDTAAGPTGTYVHFVDGDTAYRFLCASNARAGLTSFAAIKSSADCQGDGTLAAMELRQKLTALYLASVGAPSAAGAGQLSSLETKVSEQLFQCLAVPGACDALAKVDKRERQVAGEVQSWLSGLMDVAFDAAPGGQTSLPELAKAASAPAGAATAPSGPKLTVLGRATVSWPAGGSGGDVIMALSDALAVNYLVYNLSGPGCAATVAGIGWAVQVGGQRLAGPEQLAKVGPDAVVLRSPGQHPQRVSAHLASLSLVINKKDANAALSCTAEVFGADLSPRSAPKAAANGGGGFQLAAGQPFTVGIQTQAVNTNNGPMMQISGIVPGSPAQSAGFQVGDIVSTLNGVAVNSADTLNSAKTQALNSGAAALTYVIFRGGQTLSVVVQVPGGGGDGTGGDGTGGTGGTGGGSVPTLTVGIQTQPVTTNNGPLMQVTGIVPGSPAQSAGFQVGDIISTLNGVTVVTEQDLVNAKAQALAGGAATLTYVVFRNGQTLSLAVPVPGGGGPGGGAGGGTGSGGQTFTVGIQVQQVTTQNGPMVQVSGIVPGSPAQAAGFQAGDLIVSLNGAQVSSSDDLANAKAQALSGGAQTLTYVVQRNGQTLSIAVPVNGGGGGGPGGGAGGGTGGGTNGDDACTNGQSRDSVMQAMMATPNHRVWHHLWHAIRNAWDGMSPQEQQEIVSTLGPAWGRRPRDGNYGEEFLQMHHVMLGMVRKQLERQGCAMYPTLAGPPMDNDPQWTVFDPNTPQQGVGGQGQMAQWNQQALSAATIQSMSLGQYGEFLETGLHNSMHVRNADPSLADPRLSNLGFSGLPSDPNDSLNVAAQDYLGVPYSSAVNPFFYRLHGYIEDRLAGWLKAHGMTGILGENGCNDPSTCYRWRRPWAGAIPGGAPTVGMAMPSGASAAPTAADSGPGAFDVAALDRLSPATRRAIFLHADMFPVDIDPNQN